MASTWRPTGDNPLRWITHLTSRAQNLSTTARYSVAVVAAVIGLLARLALNPVWQGQLPYITLFPSIMISAWLGGFGAGLVTTLLSAVGVAWLWLSIFQSSQPLNPTELTGIGVFVAVGVFISALNEAWRRGTVALVESEQQLTVTLASIGEAVLTTDQRGRITGMNDVAEQITGWSSEDALGRAVDEVLILVSEQTGSSLLSPVTRILQGAKATMWSEDTILVARDGRRIPVEESASPIRIGEGRPAGVILVFRDISERRRSAIQRDAQDRIARELAAIVETSDDAIVSKDLQSTVRSWNQAAERMFGYTAEEMIGRSIRTIIPEERWSEEDDVLRHLRLGERVDHFETIRRRNDGTDIHVSLSISPIYSSSGVVVGASKIARDITERRQAEAERARLLAREQEARAEIERAVRLKDDFLAVLSHELRTPLNAVIGYSELLLAGIVPAEGAADALQAIQRNAHAQARLVESLLDLSRVLAGKLELDLEVIELSSAVAMAVDAVQPEVLKKSLSLKVSDTGGVRVFADGPRLQQVLWNLLSNAIKFTGSGGQIVVEVSSTNTEAVIRVSDTGRGIAPALLPFVFDRFRQGEGAKVPSQTGLGLGLALVREMVIAHKGTVTAESPGEGLGSVITVRLPLLLALERALASEQTVQSHPDLRQWHPDVLIVDDEDDARRMLACMLEARGATARHVASAAAAFDAIVTRRPDVLLADVGMPEENGYSLIRRWRVHERNTNCRHVAAIAVTAYASGEDRDRALAAGFDRHVAKPIDADELVRVIADLLERDQHSIDSRT